MYRNEVAHEYSFNKEDVVVGINMIYDSIQSFLGVYDKIYRSCCKKFDFVTGNLI